MRLLVPVVMLAWSFAAAQDNTAQPTADQESDFQSLMNAAVEKGSTPEEQLRQKEAQRAAEYDAAYGKGTYKTMMDFVRKCDYAEGCNVLKTGPILKGSNDFADLRNDVVHNGLDPKSPGYQSRLQAVKTGMNGSLEALLPDKKARSAYESEFLTVIHPIISQIFTDEERANFARSHAALSGSSPAYAYLGDTMQKAGNLPAAKQAYDAALVTDPQNEKALAGRALTSYNLGDFPDAARDAAAALNVDPQDKAANAVLMLAADRMPGGALSGAGSAEGGVQDPAFQGAGFSPSAGDIRRSDGLVAEAKESLRIGDVKAAVERLSQAAEQNPRNAQALSLLSMADNRLGSYKDARAAAEAGLKLAPKSAALLDSKAFALNRLRDYKGALAAADRALSINPKDPLAYFNRAAALGGLGDRNAMLAALKAASELDAQFQPVLDKALKLPADDAALLLPGEEKPGQAAPSAAGGARPRSLWLLAAALLGGAFGALLLFAVRRGREAAPAAPAAARRIPGLLGGNFEVVREIGVGGMGVVYEGRDRSLERPVAIKRMREEIRFDPKERARFFSEAKLVAKLAHPNVVSILSILDEEGEVYLIFEYISGKTLDALIGEKGKLPFEKARDLFRGVASALDYAHANGVIHRDLKPANIMIDAEGRSRVMDFGIARLADDSAGRRPATQTVIGTPLYMAPEQEQGMTRRESDIYAMALCLYEAVTGRPPFAGSGAALMVNKLNKAYKPASTLVPGLPRALDEILARALDPAPEKRYPSADMLMKDLEAVEAPARA